MTKFDEVFFHTHVHSHFSVNDALHSVPEIVGTAARMGQQGIALTDHGVMGGVFQGYTEARDHGMKFFPGVEAYLVRSVPEAKAHKDRTRWHVGLMALNYEGYKALVRLVSRSYTEDRFFYKPLIDFEDLASLKDSGLSQHIALTTGCYFGLPIQELVNRGPAEATHVLRTFASWFPHTFVELQHHNTDHGDGWDDTSVLTSMASIAHDLGLPTILTGDCHYVDESHKHAHSMMKELAFQGDPGEDAFPGDSYHVCDGQWIESHLVGLPNGLSILNETTSSYEHLLSLNTLQIPALDSYQFLMPSVDPDPDAKLLQLTKAGLAARQADTPEYVARAKEELSVIKDTGFANYFLMVYEVCEFARSKEIRIQARGSANGSLVCWALGITDIDPLKWQLTMAGFLTRDRSKPPDIDLDTQTFRRDELIEFVSHRFRCIQQCTPSSWSWSDEDGKGSLFIQFKNMMRRRLGDQQFAMQGYGKLSTVDEIKDLDVQVHARIRELAEIKPWRSYGAHAAGFVLDSSLQPIDELVPTMRIASSKKTVTMMTMDDLEAAGLVKLDVLGLRTLESLDVVRKELGWSWQDFEEIPFDDPGVMKRIGMGQVGNGTFQLEGFAMAKGVLQMQPRDIHEVIQAAALFRPACIEAGATRRYMANRLQPHTIRYPAAVAELVLQPTYGEFIFTEQVLDLCSALGLDVETTQSILKAMKVKHGKKGYNPKSEAAFAAAEEDFLSAATQHCTDQEAADLFQLIFAFNRYGFKKAHATPYGILGYRTAWLQHHYPREFWLGVLDVVNRKGQGEKEAAYIAAARNYSNVRIHEPRIQPGEQISAGWTIVNDGLRKGVASIKGIGRSVAESLEALGVVTNLEDLAGAVSGWKHWKENGEFNGAMRTLQDAGALRPLGLKPGDTRQIPVVHIYLPDQVMIYLDPVA